MAEKPNDEATTPPESAPKPKAKAAAPDRKAAVKKPAAAAEIKKADPDKAEKAEKKPTTPADGITTEKGEKKPAVPTHGITADKKPKKKKADAGNEEGVTTEPKEKAKAPPPKAKPGVWGIDLGQCALKAIRLEDEDGQVVATAFDYIEHPKILSQPDADPDQLTREALEKFLSRNNLRGDTVCISVPGASGLARFVKLPPVEEKKISDIVKFEAKQQIPFNLDEVVWDYQKIGAGAVTDGFAMDTEIGLFAMKRDMINRSLQHFVELGVEVHYVQMAPLALCNYVAYDLLGKGEQTAEEAAADGEKRCVVGLDIGADGSILVITDGERIIWQRPIPLGGNHFTRALTKDLKLTFAKAEHVKRNATKSPDLKKILASLKPVLNDFVAEVQRSLGFFQNTHRDAELAYIIGLGNAFRLPGLQRYLEEKLQVSVKKLAKLERMSGDKVVNEQTFTENVMSFGVAYGLALQGLERSRLKTNLLPNEIRFERMVKAKKPWAAAAAAVLLLGLGGAVLGYGLDYRAYGDKRVQDAEKLADAAVKAAQANETQYTQAKANAEKEKSNVNSVIAGQKEHLNWLELVKHVSRAVPQPDGRNWLTDRQINNWPADASVRKAYWEDPPRGDEAKRPGAVSGEKAFKMMSTRQSQLRAAERPKDPPANPMQPGRDGPVPATPAPTELPAYFGNLVQFNIEAVDARYCDDLDAFWTYLRSTKRVEAGDVRPRELVDRDPAKDILPSKLSGGAKGGWVIEVRGFTFHRENRDAVRDLLLENLARELMPDFNPKEPDKALPTNKGPVLNRVSHVVRLPDPAYGATSQETESTTVFTKIGTSVVDGLVKEAARPATTGPADARGGPANPNAPAASSGAASRDTWVPVTGAASTRPSGEAPKGNDTGALPPSKNQLRTEFVVLFFWREPTPSDELRGLKTAEAPAAAQPPGPGGQPPQPVQPAQPAQKPAAVNR